MSSLGGLVAFNSLIETSGLAHDLRRLCAPLKKGYGVVYPMDAQVRLLLDLFVSGATRLFDLEAFASDPLFVHLAGGRLCCLDTLYTDVQRFDDPARQQLADLLAQQALAALRGRLLPRLHIDIDTSVCPVFGDGIEGAVPGYNPQYHGRNSYHPLLARIAETGTLLGAQLRPGNTTLGSSDAAQVDRWLSALDDFLGKARRCLVTVRIDKGGDCAALFQVIAKHRARFLVKARMTPDLVTELLLQARWKTIEYDADNTVLTQITGLAHRLVHQEPGTDRRFRLKGRNSLGTRGSPFGVGGLRSAPGLRPPAPGLRLPASGFRTPASGSRERVPDTDT